MKRSYDITRKALYFPGANETVFTRSAAPKLHAIAAECARLAYYGAETNSDERLRLENALEIVKFRNVEIFCNNGTGTFAFGAYRATDNSAILSFRGSQIDEISDFGTDLNIAPINWKQGMGKVHSGFELAFKSIQEEVGIWIKNLPIQCNLTMTGHSLGGALATLASSVYPPSLLLTIGCPKVGDKDFCSSIQSLNYLRLINCCDVVSRMPPDELFCYRHPNNAVYIDRHGSLNFNPLQELLEQDQETARIQYFQNFAWKSGSVLFRDLADHSPVNYLRAFY